MNLKSKVGLKEGLFKGDLVNLIEPTISIDEYRSKILADDESIVVVFLVANRDAAFDLSSFIERGPFPVLDTEVADKLNSDGFYSVYVEMERNAKFFKNFLFMLSKINRLVEFKMKDWSFEAYKMAGKKPLSLQNLNHNVRIQKASELPILPTEMEQSDELAIQRINY